MSQEMDFLNEIGGTLVRKEKKPRKILFKLGRPAKYTKVTFRGKVEEYLNDRKKHYENTTVTLLDFCVYAGIYKDYISEHDLEGTAEAWSKNDFSETIKILKTICENDLQYNAMNWTINPAMAIFSLKNNYGWKEKTEVEQKTEHSWEVRIIKPPISE